MDPIPSSNAGTARVIGGDTRLLAVLGDPVRHSLSPVMHNAALAALGLDARYLALPVSGDRLAEAVQGLAALGCAGFNVTIPHKERIAPLLTRLEPVARQLGAVNTVLPDGGGGWIGTNTDWEGFLAPLQQRPLAGRQALMLGSGGSGRAVLRAAAALGLGEVVVRGRDPGRLQALVQAATPWAPPLRPLDWNAPLDAVLPTTALVVNVTPLGMGSQSEAMPLEPADLARLPAEALVVDLIYTPRPTRLLREAAALGLATLDGLEMLVQQGAAALRLWTGRAEVPVAVMRQAVERALNGPA
ncbi:MAG: shikimate dehydrogenase [Synechococcus sp. Tobar2m-G35]|nr:shikimate dehydrogenase [Synechococcus sp. Tobar2m-G35]